MSKTKTLLLLLLVVVTTTVLFPGTCAAPYVLLQSQVISAGWPTNSFPAFMALHRDTILTLMPYANGVYVLNTESAAGVKKSDLPSSDKYVYPYILNTASLRGEDVSDLPSGSKLRKSNITGTTADKYAFPPTLGDVIGLIPFLPIQINVPNVISSVMTFFNWMTNRRPQEQSTPRIYFLLRNHHGYRLYPLSVWPALSVLPEDNHPSYGGLTGRLVQPAYNAPAA